ncbi:hypothetical protein PACTADRAFT_48840 [Pachysolen tannophilus NRRL Y-2460]|uniref:rRNA methyltransferase 1, mitochondrial n=1 Tax=Pachysolen tannophilus NRRL Y-2460 TaxID=669874 RepID=A0A1E4TZA9_PACTA|nr:hypothetical protein PACTADRAFT_48840 [Pachysolen tannophilus NRRL Y-2460]
MVLCRRCFGTFSIVRAEIKAPFKSGFGNGKNVNIEKNLVVNRKPKAWERAGEDKESWYKRKYAHVHAKDKKRYQQYNGGSRGDQGDRGGRGDRGGFVKMDAIRKLQPSPLHDYVFGTSPVIAALKANKREAFLELLIYNPKEKHDEIVELAKLRECPYKFVDSKHELNLLTHNNVHNGYVLKTKPLLANEIFKLGESNSETGEFSIFSKGFDTEIVETHQIARSNITKNFKHAFGLYLDEISDPHNVGAILRTAYYLGVDFVITSERNCSPLSPVVSKTSSGAMEFLPIYNVNKPLEFFNKSQENGWKFISTSAPTPKNKKDGRLVSTDDLNQILHSNPTILVLGSEGEGVRTSLKARSNYVVELEANRDNIDESIDSLNVSVAAGLLIHKFLKP